jgi:hypothetical protein
MAEGTLNYLAGRGWLIFSGGNTPDGEIRALAIARAKTYGITAYISSADDGGDALMDDMEDLGARSGYFIDLEMEESEDTLDELKTSSLVVIEVGTSIDTLHAALRGDVLEGVKQAYQNGGVVLIEGLAVNLFGRWVVADDGAIIDGLNWVKNAFIEPESTGAEDSRAVKAVLSEMADAVAINIEAGAALALGPNGAIERWGEDANVTISLGRKFTESDEDDEDE